MSEGQRTIIKPVGTRVKLHGTPEEQAKIIAAMQRGEKGLYMPFSYVRGNLPGRNDKCYCGSGKKFKNCCRK